MERLIQIVEDDADIRFIVEYILESENYKVETYEGANAFLNRTQKETVDLIILDVMLPDGSGIEISKALKANIETSAIPVIIMSAHANINVVFNEGSADCFIQKPFDVDFFILRVKEVLEKQGYKPQGN